MSLFDGIQKACFTATSSLFGDIASWTPSNNIHTTIVEKVHFKSPNDKYQVGDSDKMEFNPYNYSVEFFIDKFPGLKLLVDSGVTQTITVKDIQLVVREVKTKFDGKTVTAYCELYDATDFIVDENA